MPRPAPDTTSEKFCSAEADWGNLLTLAQDGDRSAYSNFLKSVTPYLRQIGRTIGLAPHDIEDGIQETLLTIHSVRHTYDPSRPAAPWIAAIARNRMIDRARRVGRHANRESELTDLHETTIEDVANSLGEESDARRLHAAIQELTPGQRQAIEMVKFKEMSLKEASIASGLSETALKVAVHRAIKRLRSIMGVEA